jgi:hypothetical protein
MAKSLKKQKRRLDLLRLRGEFLEIEDANRMSMKAISASVTQIVGYQKFMTYVISSNRLSEWHAFKDAKTKTDKHSARVLKDKALQRDVLHNSTDEVHHDLSVQV